MNHSGLNSQQGRNGDSPDISQLVTVLNYFYPVGEGIKNSFRKHSYSCFFNKGKLLLKAGDICQHIYFIKKGVVRGFVKESDKDITTWITADNELLISINGLNSDN